MAGKYPPGSILDRINGQLPCHITFTTQKTAEIIRKNLHKSPMYSGQIEGVGPRYCPSIEDKIVKFAEKERHQIFLEPEGIATDEYYVNGCSTSLPFEVQVEMVRTIIGCENAEILRPAYAVEYDFCSIQPNFIRPLKRRFAKQPVSCRSNKWHLRLRRGRCPGPHGGSQCGLKNPGKEFSGIRPRSIVHRRID